MRILNTAELSKVADPKVFEKLTKQPEPEPDPQLLALERLVTSIEEAQSEQRQIFAEILTALKSKGDEKQIAAMHSMGQTIVSSMEAQSGQIAKALESIKTDRSQPDATDRLTKAVAILTTQRSEANAETFAKLDRLIDKLALVGARDPVVNIDNPVTVEMPEPAKEYRVDVVRTPQGLIDHAVIKREP
jgi:hypothetical protein